MVRLSPNLPSAERRSTIVRIELTASRRRWLTSMATEAGIAVDTLASRLLSDVIDDDAAAHKAARLDGASGKEQRRKPCV